MNWIDILILAMLGVFSLTGLRNGLVRTGFLAIGLICGIMLSDRYHGALASVISDTTPNWAEFLSISVMLIIALTAGGLVGLAFTRLLPRIGPSLVDRLAGLTLGLGVGGVLCGVLIVGITKYPLGNVLEGIGTSPIARYLIDNLFIVNGVFSG